MKKLLLSTVALLIFSLGIIIFQLSCQKTVNAQTSSSDLILYYRDFNSIGELWLVNEDGTGKRQITPSLPSGTHISANGARLNSNKNKVIFLAIVGANQMTMYECNIDGTNLVKIVDEGIPLAVYQIEGVN